MNNSLTLFAGATLLATLSLTAVAAPPPANSVRVRGTIHSLTPKVLTVSSAAGPVKIQLAGPPQVVSVVPSSRAQIKPGSFLGIASVTQANGTQKAAEVVVFPEAARGTGEGSYDWDLPTGGKGHSKMTNGTVSQSMSHSRMTNGTMAMSHSKMTNGTVSRQTGGSAITLQYKSGAGMGSQAITLPANIPVVTFAPGQASQLTPGAHVIVFAARQPNGGLKAQRILVGKNGLTPPM
ncbi:MAG: hypothetical protein ACRYFS_05560 [Janthinobacterium lividum]